LIRGLGLLTDSWEEPSLFPDHGAFADEIRKYRQDLIEAYGVPAGRAAGARHPSVMAAV
jgi:hypothetical protein